MRCTSRGCSNGMTPAARFGPHAGARDGHRLRCASSTMSPSVMVHAGPCVLALASRGRSSLQAHHLPVASSATPRRRGSAGPGSVGQRGDVDRRRAVEHEPQRVEAAEHRRRRRRRKREREPQQSPSRLQRGDAPLVARLGWTPRRRGGLGRRGPSLRSCIGGNIPARPRRSQATAPASGGLRGGRRTLRRAGRLGGRLGPAARPAAWWCGRLRPLAAGGAPRRRRRAARLAAPAAPQRGLRPERRRRRERAGVGGAARCRAVARARRRLRRRAPLPCRRAAPASGWQVPRSSPGAHEPVGAGVGGPALARCRDEIVCPRGRCGRRPCA